MPSYAVIGGSRGIGLEFVRQLSANTENTVVVIVRNKARSTYLANVAQQQDNIYILEADIADSASLKAAAAETAKITGGGLDILVHNAARMERENLYKGFTDYPSDDDLDAEFISSFRVNVLGIIHSINAFLPLLRQRPTKKILVVSSAGGEVEFVRRAHLANMAAYGTTRASSNMVVTKFGLALEQEGFLVVAFSPGLVDTSDTSDTSGTDKHLFEEAARELGKDIPGYRASTPQEAVERMLAKFETLGPDDNGKLHLVPHSTVS